MTAKRISYAELIAYAAGEIDETTAPGITEHLKTNAQDAAVVARFHVLCAAVRYLALWQPSEFLLTRAKSLYRTSQYPA